MNPLKAIPATWAGVRLVRHSVSTKWPGIGAEELDAVIALFLRAKAHDEHAWRLAEDVVELTMDLGPRWWTEACSEIVALYRQRFEAKGPRVWPYFDEQLNELRNLVDDRSRSIVVSGGTLSAMVHLHEWRASTAFSIVVRAVREDLPKNAPPGTRQAFVGIVVAIGKARAEAPSLWNKALVGGRDFLGDLGVPQIARHTFPVAFHEDRWWMHGGCVRASLAPDLAAPSSFDVVDYFLTLRAQGRLPLVDEEDVRKYLIALALPLLRDLAPGLLGIVWFLGLPGAGKDFLADLGPKIWEKAGREGTPAAFDLSITDDLELKRSAYAAGSSVYARAKEAGKRRGAIDLLIRFAGTPRLPARGMRQNETTIVHRYTTLADSAEDLPDRKEIARRAATVRVGVHPELRVDDGGGLGALEREVLRRAPEILSALKHLVETRPQAFYTDQSKTQGRPPPHVALAELFEVDLGAVRGRDLSELFEAMLEYQQREPEQGEARREECESRRNVRREEKLLPSFSLAHFIDVMGSVAGWELLFREFSSRRKIELALLRETDFGSVKNRREIPYLPVTINERRYAYSPVNDGRRFILEPELIYCNKLGLAPLHPPALPSSMQADVAPAPTEKKSANTKPAKGPFVYTDAELDVRMGTKK